MYRRKKKSIIPEFVGNGGQEGGVEAQKRHYSRSHKQGNFMFILLLLYSWIYNNTFCMTI